MGQKPAVNTSSSKSETEKRIEELEARVIWALNFLHCRGMGIVADSNFQTLGHWTHWFADALEMGGRYKVDRELLGRDAKGIKRILKARESAKAGAPAQDSGPKTQD
jgi:hypothetical protein